MGSLFIIFAVAVAIVAAPLPESLKNDLSDELK